MSLAVGNKVECSVVIKCVKISVVFTFEKKAKVKVKEKQNLKIKSNTIFPFFIIVYICSLVSLIWYATL